jgi:hypothetical protein
MNKSHIIQINFIVFCRNYNSFIELIFAPISKSFEFSYTFNFFTISSVLSWETMKNWLHIVVSNEYLF